MKQYNRLIHLFAGPLLLVLCFFLLPHEMIGPEGRGAIGTVAWMAYWWAAGKWKPPGSWKKR